MQKLVITQEDSGQRLDKYLKRILPEAGTSFLYKMLRKKNITLNGKKAEGSEKIQPGDEISVFFSDDTFLKFCGASGTPSDDNVEPRGAAVKRLHESLNSHDASEKAEYRDAYRKLKTQIGVVYEDEHILLANKSAGILVQKSLPGDQTLNEWFVGYLLDKGETDTKKLSYYMPSICNRLDRNTSGIVICAKTLQASRTIAELLRSRKLRKYYHLAAAGMVETGGVIEGFLGKDTDSNIVTLYDKQVPGTSFTKTVYEPVTCMGAGKAGNDSQAYSGRNSRNNPLHGAVNSYTIIEAELVTGKTHQLRAHFAWIGHPIIGDSKYGDPDVNAYFKKQGIRSQCLTCCRVEFPVMKGALSYLSGKQFTVSEPWRLPGQHGNQ